MTFWQLSRNKTNNFLYLFLKIKTKELDFLGIPKIKTLFFSPYSKLFDSLVEKLMDTCSNQFEEKITLFIFILKLKLRIFEDNLSKL